MRRSRLRWACAWARSAKAPTSCTPALVVADLVKERPVNSARIMAVRQADAAVDVRPNAGGAFAAIGQINHAPAKSGRKALFDALQTLGVNGWANGDLSRVEAAPGEAFADEPLQTAAKANGA